MAAHHKFGERMVERMPTQKNFATDGITEARCGRAFLGNDGLALLVEQAGTNAPLSMISKAIYDGALDFSQGNLRDDVCLLLARRQ